ncbi:MAG: YiaA/YiaB family inner membrane protein, partial [Gammaproteobacteria bacterium]
VIPMNDASLMNQNTQGWMFFVKACFVASVAAMSTAIVFLPAVVWVKGYLGMGTLLIVASSFMLSKSIRDDFEAAKVTNRLSEAKAEKLIKELDVAA